MSYRGIKKVAEILSQMQDLRIQLLDSDKQDILLGQLLETAKETIKDDFSRIVQLEIEVNQP